MADPNAFAKGLQAGSSVGLRVVKGFQQTHDLMVEREQRKQAQQVMAQIREQEQAITSPIQAAVSSLQSLQDDLDKGKPVSSDDLRAAQVDVLKSTLRGMEAKQDMYMRVIAAAPDNPHIQASVGALGEQNMRGFQAVSDAIGQMNGLVTQAEEAAADREFTAGESAKDRDLRRELTREELDVRRRGQDINADLTRSDQALRATQMTLDEQHRRAESGRAERRLRMDEEHHSQIEMPSGRVRLQGEQLNVMGTATDMVTRMKQAGASDDQINAALEEAGIPLDAQSLIGAWRGLSENTQKELRELEGAIRREKRRIEEGGGDERRLKVYEERYEELLLQGDEIRATEYEWSNVEKDRGKVGLMAEKAKDKLIELGRGAVGVAAATSPFYWMTQLVKEGPAGAEPVKEARREAKDAAERKREKTPDAPGY